MMEPAIESEVRSTDPMAIEPFDKEWGVGVSGVTENPSPFPRINKILNWLKNRNHAADHERAVIYTDTA